MPTLSIFGVEMRRIEGSWCLVVDIIFLSLQGQLAGRFDRDWGLSRMSTRETGYILRVLVATENVWTLVSNL